MKVGQSGLLNSRDTSITCVKPSQYVDEHYWKVIQVRFSSAGTSDVQIFINEKACRIPEKRADGTADYRNKTSLLTTR
ncbi:hypothetical protein KIN20_026636 [Parelaphostrongylus tenuis]|uniref:Uncharacterized protein n=1 Tax=Parelaphostrongylus tenuis TaxID=148309 RepID=A0AAD5QY79_PARTN|nr:hypothetical protein KIN20_026636 [Parelaphostrongylus tenuis]